MASLRFATRPRSPFISIWFALDALLGLLPPVYWLLGGPTPLFFGLPCSIVYFGGLAIFILLSIIVAYVDDERRGAFGPAS
ncbi:hypothetical protein SAMN07250955_10936 [Arboricoccus pini]|uniref:Solute:sodium symporter small subunit n=1 Tax=Arboricoccus pini TaxID=1963835 RepID=A0A212RI64_9PROT|nr:hypothetical protein [Arboricoccus pini]SNB72113.1 hypothetical protein SAMN07250955_10936 [Arboricoccus pini]